MTLIEQLPADLQSNEAFKDMPDTGTLATKYLELHGRVTGGNLDLIPEEFRKDPSLANFKNVSDVAKSYIETKKLVGQIKKAPETADGYKFTPVEGLDPDFKSAPDIQKSLTAIFHKAGIPNEQADIVQREVLATLSGGVVKSKETKEALAKTNETALRQEWGADYEKNFTQIQNALLRAGGEEAIKAVGDLGAALKSNVTALKIMHKILGKMSEDSISNLGDLPQHQASDKEGALKEIERMKNVPSAENPLMNVKHKDYAKATAEFTRLHQVAYGG